VFGVIVDVRFLRDQVAGTLQFFHNDRRRCLEVVHLGLEVVKHSVVMFSCSVHLRCLRIVEIRF